MPVISAVKGFLKLNFSYFPAIVFFGYGVLVGAAMVVKGKRPCEINTAVQLLVTRPHDFSFPSGHTAASFAAVGTLYFAGEKKLWKPALVLAVLIAFSRLYLYVHYPSDIIGGIVVGLMAGYAGKRIADWMEQKWMRRQPRDRTEEMANRFIFRCAFNSASMLYLKSCKKKFGIIKSRYSFANA